MTDTPALEPCPWCGGSQAFLAPTPRGWWSAMCADIQCAASGPHAPLKPVAAQAWNEVASAARKWRKAAKITWHDPASGGRPDRVNLWPAPIPDRPTCSLCPHGVPAVWLDLGRVHPVPLCDEHKKAIARHNPVRFEPITQPMTDQPTAFHIKADIYKAEPCDRERASGPSVALSADNDSVHCVDRDGTKSCFPRAAIPAIREALRQLQENPNE